MVKQTLLQKAQAVRDDRKRLTKKPSVEEVDLMLAFLNGNISRPQTAVALGKANQSVAIIYWAWSVLREAYANEMISVTKRAK